MKFKVIQDHQTLDEIVFKNYGSSFGYLELVLSANVFLYEQDVFLTKGIEIELPSLELFKEDYRIELWN